MTGVRGLGHINIRAPAALIWELRQFYIDIVGLREGPRPTFRSGSNGHWLYAGELDVVHLSVSTAPVSSDAPRSTGWLSHIAFECSDLSATLAVLEENAIEYELDEVDALNQVQIFLTDPAGIGIELTFLRS
jgi:catechol-2,3-dioxygenase